MPASSTGTDSDPGTDSGSDPGLSTGPGAPSHQQRERALSLLYEAELKGETPRHVLDSLPVRPDDYVCTLLNGAEATRTEADTRITAASVGWPKYPAPTASACSACWGSRSTWHA